MARGRATLNIPQLLVERIERAMALGWTGAYSRDEFARQCIEARLDLLERLRLDAALESRLANDRAAGQDEPLAAG